MVSGIVVGLIGLTKVLTNNDLQFSPPQSIPIEKPTILDETRSYSTQKINSVPTISGINPSRIQIPVIGVNASIIQLGLNKDGTLQVPENFDWAGWWKKGYRPGERGSAVIVGHFDSKTGPAVFYHLRKLKVGDEILVMNATGRTVRFEVERLQQVAKHSFPTATVYGKSSKPTLRIVTCAGAFKHNHYLDNLIVFASLSSNMH
jgi:LPXTG-site transpeptidase (sortase) family protein